MAVPFGPEPGPGEVRLEITSGLHFLLARLADLLQMDVELCFWHATSDGWEVLQRHHQDELLVRLPPMTEPKPVRLNCLGGNVVEYPRQFWSALGMEQGKGQVVGFTGAIDARTVRAATEVAAHFQCSETDAYNILALLGAAARLPELLGGNSYLRSPDGSVQKLQLDPIDDNE